MTTAITSPPPCFELSLAAHRPSHKVRARIERLPRNAPSPLSLTVVIAAKPPLESFLLGIPSIRTRDRL